MISDIAHCPVMRLSTDALPARDRAAMAQEIFGRQILNLELEQNPDDPPRVDFTLHALPGLKIVTGFASGIISRRTSQLLADSNDDLFLSLNETNTFFASQRGHEVVMNAGEAVLMSCAEPAAFRRSHGRAIGLRIPRSMFNHISPVIEDLAGLRIPRNNEALRLLQRYVAGIGEEPAMSLTLGQVISTHIRDLLTLAIESTGEAAMRAAGRGLKAARLREIKSYITTNLHIEDLSIGVVAGAHALSDRYVQRLFEAEGTTFTNLVVQQRLARAYRLLLNPLHIERRINGIALDCGFTDVSHFNRMFKRIYGFSPSDVRQNARRSPGIEESP
jgi:AraC-like DNA-binding protein